MKNAYFYYFFLLFSFPFLSAYGHTITEKPKINPPQANALTLEQAMDRTQAHSYQLKIATQNVNITENQKNSRILALFPNVSATGQYLKPVEGINSLLSSNVGPDVSIITDGVSYTAGATLSQPIVGLLSTIFQIGENSAKLRAAYHDKSQTIQDQRYIGANAYINATKAFQFIAVAQKAIEVAEKQQNDGEARFNEGLLTSADVLQFRLNYDNAKTAHVRAQTAYQISLVTLSEFMGEPDSESIILPTTYVSVMKQKKENLKNLNGLVKDRVPVRYDILAAQENVSAQGYSTLNSMTSYLPSFNFILQYAHDFRAEAPSGSPFTKHDVDNELFWGFRLEWNILDWGIRQTQINVASASEQIARLQLYQTHDNAKIDITTSYSKLIEAYETLHFTESSLQYAETVYTQRFEEFQSGLISSTDLVIASNDQNSARANYVSAVGDLDLAWMAFYKSTRQPLTTIH